MSENGFEKQGSEQNLGDTQTAECVSGSALPCQEVLDGTEQVCSDFHGKTDTLSTTSASEQDELFNCVLCGGSGLLCAGQFADPCPLCEQKAESDSDQPSDRVGYQSVIDFHETSVHGGPGLQSDADAGNSDFATEDQVSLRGVEESTAPQAQETHNKTVSTPAPPGAPPPGLGPPGTWIWPDADSKKTTGAETLDCKPCCPELPTICQEVDFVSKVALSYFGTDFKKMDVAWKKASVQGKLILPHACVELHLKRVLFTNLMPPLWQLERALESDQKVHGCQIFRMERSTDKTLLHFTCIHVTADTCWDMLKGGRCPRSNTCPWAHPVPILLSVSCVDEQTAEENSIAKANVSDEIRPEGRVAFPPSDAFPPSRMLVSNTTTVNITAYDD
jgi:hypothetical protein